MRIGSLQQQHFITSTYDAKLFPMLSAPEHRVHNTVSPGVSLYLNPVACKNRRKNNKLGEWNKEMSAEKDSARRSKETQT